MMRLEDSINVFSSRYALMQEDELRRLAEDVKNLVPKARDALRAEFVQRHLSIKSVDWNARTSLPTPRRKTNLIGDAEGEYREMERGRYSAWIHVVIAFGLEVGLLAYLATKLLNTVFPSELWLSVGIVCSLALTVLIYANRWRCIEAYASEWCTGILHVSLFLVPFAAFIYANYRGLRKFSGR